MSSSSTPTSTLLERRALRVRIGTATGTGTCTRRPVTRTGLCRRRNSRPNRRPALGSPERTTRRDSSPPLSTARCSLVPRAPFRLRERRPLVHVSRERRPLAHVRRERHPRPLAHVRSQVESRRRHPLDWPATPIRRRPLFYWRVLASSKAQVLCIFFYLFCGIDIYKILRVYSRRNVRLLVH